MTAGFWRRPPAERPAAKPGKALTMIDLTGLARDRGLWACPAEGDLPRLLERVARGYPAVALLNFGVGPWSIPHYVVVTGYDLKRPVIYFHSTWRRDSFLSPKSFQRFWKRGGSLWLTMAPPDEIRFPLSPEEANQLGVFHLETGRPEAAAAAFQQALAGREAYLYRFNLAVALERSGRKDEAERTYRQVLAVHPFGPAFNNLAELRLKNDPGEAEKLARQALENDPDRRAYYLDTLGLALLKGGQPEAAREQLEMALAAAERDYPELAGLIRGHLEELKAKHPSN
ncbi:MAG: Tetratricopeptide repeat protein [candidate division TA06 bacterium ADurb.Bin417]|uniref:Tetratricopeptide repeat protein n=1 Tax=candidate division TA06 bacterium ADurb.Bin417 TaxID=1852828 RepID=A0A1V5MDU8_UNCT6|nr:MAG: Tetratricopeptide repeat protein [candidate division TA06 bacterium ADurb.Bin417]